MRFQMYFIKQKKGQRVFVRSNYNKFFILRHYIIIYYIVLFFSPNNAILESILHYLKKKTALQQNRRFEITDSRVYNNIQF